MTDVVRFDRTGSEEARAMDAGVIDEALEQATDPSRFRTFVEQHRHAAFDERQQPVVVEELRALQAQLADAGLRDRMEALIRFVTMSLAEPGKTVMIDTG